MELGWRLRGRSLRGPALGLVIVLWPAGAWGYEQPRNTISLGLQGQYGYLTGAQEALPEDVAKGSWARLFDFGEGLTLRIRYSTARNRAIGFSFEDQRFRRAGNLDDRHPAQIQISQFLLEYYLYFQRPKKVARYIVLGGGIHRPVIREQSKDPETEREVEQDIFPGESLTLMTGVGVEYFVVRQASLDFSLRGYGMLADPTNSVAAELAVGMHYYTD